MALDCRLSRPAPETDAACFQLARASLRVDLIGMELLASFEFAFAFLVGVGFGVAL